MAFQNSDFWIFWDTLGSIDTQDHRIELQSFLMDPGALGQNHIFSTKKIFGGWQWWFRVIVQFQIYSSFHHPLYWSSLTLKNNVVVWYHQVAALKRLPVGSRERTLTKFNPGSLRFKSRAHILFRDQMPLSGHIHWIPPCTYIRLRMNVYISRIIQRLI